MYWLRMFFMYVEKQYICPYVLSQRIYKLTLDVWRQYFFPFCWLPRLCVLKAKYLWLYLEQFLHIGPTDIWGQASLCCERTVLCTVGSTEIFLTSIHQRPVASPHPLSWTLPNDPFVTKSPQLRTTGLEQNLISNLWVSENSIWNNQRYNVPPLNLTYTIHGGWLISSCKWVMVLI